MDENEIKTHLGIEITDGEHIIFRSSELSALLNSQYKWQLSGYVDIDSVTGKVKQKGKVGYISKKNFKSDNRDESLSFLAGAYARFAKDNQIFCFVNAKHKADLVAELLKEFGCKNVLLSHSEGYVPVTYFVSFEPTEEVKSWCGAFGSVK